MRLLGLRLGLVGGTLFRQLQGFLFRLRAGLSGARGVGLGSSTRLSKLRGVALGFGAFLGMAFRFLLGLMPRFGGLDRRLFAVLTRLGGGQQVGLSLGAFVRLLAQGFFSRLTPRSGLDVQSFCGGLVLRGASQFCGFLDLMVG